jgi:hypothetical protein
MSALCLVSELHLKEFGSKGRCIDPVKFYAIRSFVDINGISDVVLQENRVLDFFLKAILSNIC